VLFLWWFKAQGTTIQHDGMSIVSSGTDYETAQTASSLLALAISSLLIPAAFHAALGTTITSDNGVLQISRATSVILLVVYAMFIAITYVKLTFRYLYFQLKSHSYLYDEIAFEETEAALEHATITPWWSVGLYVQND
jgi:Ca2+:H+ antiporter